MASCQVGFSLRTSQTAPFGEQSNYINFIVHFSAHGVRHGVPYMGDNYIDVTFQVLSSSIKIILGIFCSILAYLAGLKVSICKILYFCMFSNLVLMDSSLSNVLFDSKDSSISTRLFDLLSLIV